MKRCTNLAKRPRPAARRPTREPPKRLCARSSASGAGGAGLLSGSIVAVCKEAEKSMPPAQ